MKALSIKGEWCLYIRDGLKTIETRTWYIYYRGRLLLCASKFPQTELSGMAFAVCDLVAVLPMTKKDERQALCEVYPKAYSWFLENVKVIKPFPVKGRLNIFEVDYTEVEE